VSRGTLEEQVLALLEEKISMFELVVGEVGAILGGLEEEREFPDLVLEAWLETTEAARTAAFDTLGRRLDDASRQHQGAKALDDKLFTLQGRIDFFNSRLNRERDRLLNKFYASEVTISKLQANTNFLQTLQTLWKAEQAELEKRGIKTMSQSADAAKKFNAGARSASLARMKERMEKAGGTENYDRVVQLFTPG